MKLFKMFPIRLKSNLLSYIHTGSETYKTQLIEMYIRVSMLRDCNTVFPVFKMFFIKKVVFSVVSRSTIFYYA